MYKIGELSRICKIPVKTLRYYDSIGLLIPDEIDRFTGYRYYSAAKIGECNRIAVLKELGFSLDEIKLYLKSTSETVVSLIDKKAKELEMQKERLALSVEKLVTMKENILGENRMYNIIIRSGDSISVAMKRDIFKNREHAYQEIQTMKNALKKVVGNRSVIINNEIEFKENDLDFTLCVEISSDIPKSNEYEQCVIPLDGDVATLTCSKADIDNAYASLIKHVNDNGFISVGAIYEIYHDDVTIELKVPIQKIRKLNQAVNKQVFEDDKKVIGKWELIDIVPSEKQFCYSYPKCDCRYDSKELYFLPNGEGYWIYDSWSKGCLYQIYSGNLIESNYNIREINGQILMFLKENICYNGMLINTKQVKVYKKISDKAYAKSEISIHDNTELPMIADNSVVGKWVVRDYYRDYNPDNFDFSVQNRENERLHLRALDFDKYGNCTMITKNSTTVLPYTKGCVINRETATISAYEIRVIDGNEYLFFQWKRGDYTYGGGKINMYVMTR